MHPPPQSELQVSPSRCDCMCMEDFSFVLYRKAWASHSFAYSMMCCDVRWQLKGEWQSLPWWRVLCCWWCTCLIVAAMHVICKHYPYTTKAFQHNAATAVKQCMQRCNISGNWFMHMKTHCLPCMWCGAGSSQANPFACIASGIAALWGPAHGGANEAVLRMLKDIGSRGKIPEAIKRAKDKNDSFR